MIKDIHVIDGWYNKPSKEIILKHNTGGKVYISVDKLDSHNEFTWYVLGEQQLEQEDPIITPDPQDPDTPEVDTPTYYTVSIALAEHGTVTVSGLTNGKILEGGKITIEAQPEDGYRLYSLRLVMNDGTDLELYDNINRYTYLIYNNIQIVAGFTVNEVNVPDDPEIPDTPLDPDFPIPTYVDLGLSVYWASWNVGENAPYGNTKRYGWGDATGTVNTEVPRDYTKSLSTSITSIAGMVDYDIARRQYGSNWRMPTLAEFLELYDETKITRESVKINEVNGVKFTSKADPTKYIFLPGCGMQHPRDGLLQYDGSCYYWTATGSYATNTGWLGLMVWAMEGVLDTSYRYDVCWHVPVRAVKIKNSSTPDEPTTNPTFPKPSAAVDLGLSVDWSPWNIGGSSATDNTHLYGWGDPTGTVTSEIRGDYADDLPEAYDANIAGNANYDIAAKQWGGGWRMPTKEEFTELYNGCNIETTSVNGQGVYKFINKQDSNKYIIIPFDGGVRLGLKLYLSDTPFYWTANGVSEDGELKGVNAQLKPSFYEEQHYPKFSGMLIRPVKDKQGSNPGGGQQELPTGEGATQHFTFVDLGLPNHTKWATCNVGAENPLDFGAYYAYGCTEETTDFSQSSYPYYVNGAYQAPGGGNICGKVNYDAAAKVSGGIAQMPTKDQIKELIDNCTWDWEEHYNGSYTNGYLVTGPNGNSIFMPACGHYGVYASSGQSELNGTNTTGYYWSGEVVNSVANLFSTYGNANCLVTGQPEANTQTVSCPGTVAHSGCCIRPVAANNNIATVGAAVDLGLSNGTLWSDRNIGATKDSDYGGYFQWGDVNSHTDGFGEQDYQYYNSATNTYTDIAGVICGDARYDAATYNWGSLWTIPSKDDFHWLILECTWVWTLKNGINGYQITGINGNSIFLPACGSRTELGLDADNRQGNYWSGTVWSNNSERNMAWELIFESNYKDPGYLGRSVGCCIRPVMKTLN